jgi:glycosyltransferase involved in cell wall biosynthesis
MEFSRDLRIAFVCFSASLGGLELTTFRLARDLKTRKAHPLLVVPRGTPLADLAVKNGLDVEILNPTVRYGDVFAALRLARVLSSRRIDIVVLMQSKDINVAAIAAVASPRAKLVYYQQMQSGVNKRDFLHTWMYSKLSRWITLTNRMKREVLAHTRVPEEMISVVSLGRDMNLFDPKSYNQRAMRERYGLPLERPIVATLGRLDPQKGQEEFLRSLPLVLKDRKDAYFVIAGDETRGEEGYKKRLLDLSSQLGVSDNVGFFPFTEEVPEFMAAIDLFVLPSYSETYGLVLIEAMAMGKPVVATDAGGVPEIVEDGRDGLLVPPRDEKALADAIVRILKDPSLQSSFSNQARKDALERFDAARCVDQLVRLLDAL